MFHNVEQVNSYLEAHSDKEDSLLKRINRETYLKETMPHMMSGHYQGRVLAMISKMVNPKHILEIGTFTGYATLCLAEGLQKDGVLYTIDINEEQEARVSTYFAESAYGSQIDYRIGDALELIPTIAGTFDLVFIDADKKRNLVYYTMLIDRIPKGGLILIDNVLWKGKIFDENPDSQTKQVLALNDTLAADDRVEKLILPIRDGLFVLRKK